jgi:hypothetical protein
MTPCCGACELREHLERRLARLEKIVPLNEGLRHAQWHRMNELQLALDKEQVAFDDFYGPTGARPKSTA